jgi:hypothetical protein
MADMVPQAVDQTSGQARPVTSADTLVDTSGGAIGSNGTTLLPAGSTVAEINTALTNFSIVYLAPGSYPVTLGTGSQITIPDGKTLRGLNVVDPAVTDANCATFVYSGTATNLSAILLAGTGWVSDLYFSCGSGTWTAVSSGNGIISGSSNWCTVERIGITSLNNGNYGIFLQKGGRVKDIRATAGSLRGALIKMVNGDANRASTVTDIIWDGSGSGLYGIWTQSGADGSIVIDNTVFDSINFSFAGVWLDGAIYSTARNCFFSNCQLTSTSSAFINIDSNLCSVQNCFMNQCGSGDSTNALIRVDIASALRVMISDCTLEMLSGAGDGVLWSGATPSYGCSISNVDVHGAGMTGSQVNFQLTTTSGGSNRCAITDCRGITSGGSTLSASTTGWNVSNVVAVS